MLSNNGLYLCSMRSTCYYFSTGSKFQSVSNFTELHALTLAAHSYAVLIFCCALNGKYSTLYTNSIVSLIFHYPNAPWSQHVQISDFLLYYEHKSKNKN